MSYTDLDDQTAVIATLFTMSFNKIKKRTSNGATLDSTGLLRAVATYFELQQRSMSMIPSELEVLIVFNKALNKFVYSGQNKGQSISSK